MLSILVSMWFLDRSARKIDFLKFPKGRTHLLVIFYFDVGLHYAVHKDTGPSKYIRGKKLSCTSFLFPAFIFPAAVRSNFLPKHLALEHKPPSTTTHFWGKSMRETHKRASQYLLICTVGAKRVRDAWSSSSQNAFSKGRVA